MTAPPDNVREFRRDRAEDQLATVLAHLRARCRQALGSALNSRRPEALGAIPAGDLEPVIGPELAKLWRVVATAEAGDDLELLAKKARCHDDFLFLDLQGDGFGQPETIARDVLAAWREYRAHQLGERLATATDREARRTLAAQILEIDAAGPAGDAEAILGAAATLDGWRVARPVSWYVDSILAPGVLSAFSAAGGRKKSLLAQSLYVHLAAGVPRPWLGVFRTVRDPLRVLVLDGECGRDRLCRRLREMVLGGLFSPDDADRALGNIDLRSIGSIKSPAQALAAVEALLQRTSLDVIVLDPLRYFLPAGIESENDNLGMGAFIDLCRALAERYRIAVLVIAHDSAAGKALRGATAQQNAVETLWQIDQPDEADRDYLVLRGKKDRDPGTEYEVGIATVRGEPVPEGDGLLYPVSFERTELRAAPERAAARGDEKATRMLAIVRAAEDHYRTTGGGIGAAALEKVAEQTRATFYRDLGSALAAGLLYQPVSRGPIYPATAQVTP